MMGHALLHEAASILVAPSVVVVIRIRASRDEVEYKYKGFLDSVVVLHRHRRTIHEYAQY